MLFAVPERSSTASEPPSSTSRAVTRPRTSDVTPGTIAMALAALSMALLVYFMN